MTTTPLAVLTLTLALTSPPAPEELRARATAAYRAGQLQEACELFGQLTRLVPGDGEAWSDLGLCLARMGRREEAVRAEKQAASSDACPARLHAYFNLYQLGQRVKVPPLPDLPSYGQTTGESPMCKAVPVDRCGPLFACAYVNDASGSGGMFLASGIMIGKDEERMRALLNPEDGEGSHPVGQGNEQIVMVPEDSYQEYFCHAGQEEGCDIRPSLTRGECAIVHVDACRLRVGLVCRSTSGGRQKVQARELPTEGEGCAILTP
jgi:hypothetical protein